MPKFVWRKVICSSSIDWLWCCGAALCVRLVSRVLAHQKHHTWFHCCFRRLASSFSIHLISLSLEQFNVVLTLYTNFVKCWMSNKWNRLHSVHQVSQLAQTHAHILFIHSMKLTSNGNFSFDQTSKHLTAPANTHLKYCKLFKATIIEPKNDFAFTFVSTTTTTTTSFSPSRMHI